MHSFKEDFFLVNIRYKSCWCCWQFLTAFVANGYWCWRKSPWRNRSWKKANSVCSLDDDHKCPITMTDSGNLGFFLEQTDASLEELWQVPKEKAAVLTAVWSLLLHPRFLTVPFFCFQGWCLPHLACGIAWCTFPFAGASTIVTIVSTPYWPLECLVKSSVLQGKGEESSQGPLWRTAGDQ